MNAIQMLREQHRDAKAAFGKIEQASSFADRGRLWKELEPELKLHEELETNCLHEPLAREVGTDGFLSDWVARHRAEVRQVEVLLGEIKSLDVKDARWLGKVQEVRTALEAHIREEEDTIWPRAQQVWDAARMEQAGAAMADMKAKRKRMVA